MKKFLITLLLSLSVITAQGAFATGFYPNSVNFIKNWGTGIYLAPHEIHIYSSPDEKAQVIETIKWDELGVSGSKEAFSSKDTFLSYIPDKNIAVMNVIDDTDDWYEVIYNQTTGEKGWIKSSEPGIFMTWPDFITKYGKESGIKIFYDTPADFKTMYTNPEETAQQVKNVYCVPNEAQLLFITGNWILIRFSGFGDSSSVGWIRWRNTNGQIFIFPNFSNN